RRVARATARSSALSLHDALPIWFSLEDFVYYAHWITPEALPQRFDTRFFLARVPAEQEATPSPYEMAEGIWIDVATALERARARSEEHTSELQSPDHLVCRLLLE